MDELTDREVEVLLAAATGRKASEVAAALRVTTSTVKRLLTGVYAKLGVKKPEEIRLRLETDEALRRRVLSPAA